MFSHLTFTLLLASLFKYNEGGSTVIPRAATEQHVSSSIDNHLSMLRDGLRVSQSSCIELFLGDTFGAGWKYSKLYIYDDEGNFDSYNPNRTSNHANVKYCYNSKSKALSKTILGSHIEKKSYPTKNVTLSITMQYFHAVNPQSMIWTARNMKTGDLYTGNHLTKMVFRFQETSISFGYAQNLVASRLNPPSCKSCMVGNVKTTMKSSSDPMKGDLAVRMTRQTSALKSDWSLHGHENTWFRSEGFGTTYEITDIGGAKVYYAGQLCSGDTGGTACSINLSEGEYVWRVNGALDPYRDEIAWTFCDSQGGARTKLYFSVDEEGHCIPGSLFFSHEEEEESMSTKSTQKTLPALSLPDPSQEEKPNKVLLKGTIDLNGLNSVEITDHEKLMLENFLNDQFRKAKTIDKRHLEVQDAEDYSAKLISWQEVVPESFYRHGRRESNAVVDRVMFTIQINRDEYMLPGHASNSIPDTQLLSNFKRYLAISMESGSFLAMIHHSSNSNLNHVTRAKLVDLEVMAEIIPEIDPCIIDDYMLALAIGTGMILGFCLFYYRSSTGKKDQKKSMKNSSSPFSFSFIVYPSCISGNVSGSQNKRQISVCENTTVTRVDRYL